MANPQIKNGYTRIANELLEAICRLDISGNEMRILLYIIRRTYGFNTSYAEIPLSDISCAVGMRREHIQKALKKLSGKKIIEVRTYGGSKSQTISVIKDYQKWSVETCATCLLPKSATVAKNGNTTVAEIGNTTVAEIGNTTVAEIGNSTYKEKKENFKDREIKPPLPEHKGENSRAFVNDDNYKNLASEYGADVIDKYIERADKWAFKKGKTLGECTETLRKWLEQDNVQRIDPDIEKYNSVINQFLPL
ncbi:replication protein [Ruminococcus flavefaciens]|uniref:replication protein n=1 Tax=Ruminococcus flavefaciens TaxID=1265 RepID=UPI0026EC1D53|nr:replication protein [Ruminococcus flavefaciens]